MVELRKVSSEQVESLQTICRETYYDTFHQFYTAENMATYLDEAYDIDVLLKELDHPDTDVYFLYDGGEIVGYLKLNTGTAQTEFVAENSMEIQRIYVRLNQKRKGFGSRLMEFSLQKAREKGCSSIWLGVWEHNEPALAFYERHGFRRVGEHYFTTGTQVDTDYIYLKDL